MIISTIARYQIFGNSKSAPLYLSQLIRNKSHVPFYRKPLHSFKKIFPIGNSILHKFSNFKRFSIMLVIVNEFKKAPKVLKDNSEGVLKSCVAQFEFVLAYRIRRGQQIFNLYSKLWDEMALKRFFQQIRRLVYRRGKEFLLGGAAVTYDWKTGRIPEEDLKSHADELELCRFLREKLNEDHVCLCDDKPCIHDFSKKETHCWSTFINQPDLIVWKKEEENHKGLYCYKMYGRYPDVTAKDFLTVFLDTENRAKWDQHVVILKVIDSEPSTNSDVIYWETKWPKMFSNRDYVFTRRYLVDDKDKVMIVMNRTTEHPDYPVMASKSRVTEYWSYMVIRPISGEFNKPGIEFCLTYFDNPGMSVPSAISSWASSTAMPSYIKRLRIEALKIYDIRTHDEITEPSDQAVVPADETKKKAKDKKDKGKKKESDASPPGGGEVGKKREVEEKREVEKKSETDDRCDEEYEYGSGENKEPGVCGTDKPKKGEMPPRPCKGAGGGEDGPSNVVTEPKKKEDKFEPLLLWTSFMEKIGAKGESKNINMDS